MQCNKLAVQYTEFLVTLHSDTGWMMFMPLLLSTTNFFLSEVLYLIVCVWWGGGGGKQPTISKSTFNYLILNYK